MREQVPAPDFDATQYERPSQNWVCGKAAEGRSCRMGPDSKGRCRARSEFECNPALELKTELDSEGKPKEPEKGEFKVGPWPASYRCTRPKEYGGPCKSGPRLDGTCSCPTRCQPVRSLRSKRRVFIFSVVAFTVAVLLLALYGPFRWHFINPNSLSLQHSGRNFLRALELTNDSQGCSGCHVAACTTPVKWAHVAMSADPAPFALDKLAARSAVNMASIDQSCQRCHENLRAGAGTIQDYNFHQANVVQNPSCSQCHPEHVGSGPMQLATSAGCVSCHGNSHTMQAAAQKGTSLPASAFPLRVGHGLNLFHAPRPEKGYTHAFQSFAQDHPEFRVHTEKWRETNTLQFNHQRHLADDIPVVNGKKLSCVSCHQPDPSGAFHQKISFQAHCQNCHDLRFDSKNEKLTLPHGDPVYVRAFLNSLPRQYADFGAGVKGKTEEQVLQKFVQEQIQSLRKEIGSTGDFDALIRELERQVFFSTDRTGPVADVGRLGNQGPSRFAGCAKCHEVTGQGEAVPRITTPFIPDRWMLHSDFTHAKHTGIDCGKCHQVGKSRDTADVLLPLKDNCISCHSPKGGVAHGCTACHLYHNQPARQSAVPGR